MLQWIIAAVVTLLVLAVAAWLLLLGRNKKKAWLIVGLSKSGKTRLFYKAFEF